MLLSRKDPQKVALEKKVQLLEDAFLKKWGEGTKALSSWSGEGEHFDQHFWGIGASSVSIPFARKWLPCGALSP